MSILFRSKGSAAEGIVKLVWPQMRAICTSNALFAEESLLAPKKKGKTSQVRDPTLKEAIKKQRMSAYTAFQREGDKLKSALRRLSFSDAMKELSSEWKAMGDEEKKKFEDIADKINGPKPEKKKAPLTAYTRFTSAHFAEERSKSQGGKGGEVFKAVAARWRALSDSEKASYKP